MTTSTDAAPSINQAANALIEALERIDLAEYRLGLRVGIGLLYAAGELDTVPVHEAMSALVDAIHTRQLNQQDAPAGARED